MLRHISKDNPPPEDVSDCFLFYAFLRLDAKVYTLDLEVPAFQAVSVQLIKDQHPLNSEKCYHFL